MKVDSVGSDFMVYFVCVFFFLFANDREYDRVVPAS